MASRHYQNASLLAKCLRLGDLPTDKTVRRCIHDLRHTFGRRLPNAGVSMLEVLKRPLGCFNTSGFAVQFGCPAAWS
jgi:hypothetical protein